MAVNTRHPLVTPQSSGAMYQTHSCHVGRESVYEKRCQSVVPLNKPSCGEKQEGPKGEHSIVTVVAMAKAKEKTLPFATSDVLSKRKSIVCDDDNEVDGKRGDDEKQSSTRVVISSGGGGGTQIGSWSQHQHQHKQHRCCLSPPSD